jgi:hypothetical protein
MMARIAQLTSQRLRGAERGTLLSVEIALIFFLSVAQAKAMPDAQNVDDRALHSTSERFRGPRCITGLIAP